MSFFFYFLLTYKKKQTTMNTPKTEFGNFTFHEVAMVSAIISDHILKDLYPEVQKRGNGYVFAVDMLANWAIEFAEKHTKTSWEKVLEEGMQPLSKEMKEIICWDDAVIDFACYKLEQYKNS